MNLIGTLAIGARVLCIRDLTPSHANVYGSGVYLGVFKDSKGQDEARFRLDSGEELSANECKVMPESGRQLLADMGLTFVQQDIKQDRATRRKLDAFAERVAGSLRDRADLMEQKTAYLSIPESGAIGGTIVGVIFSAQRTLTREEEAEMKAIITPTDKGKAS